MCMEVRSSSCSSYSCTKSWNKIVFVFFNLTSNYFVRMWWGAHHRTDTLKRIEFREPRRFSAVLTSGTRTEQIIRVNKTLCRRQEQAQYLPTMSKKYRYYLTGLMWRSGNEKGDTEIFLENSDQNIPSNYYCTSLFSCRLCSKSCCSRISEKQTNVYA